MYFRIVFVFSFLSLFVFYYTYSFFKSIYIYIIIYFLFKVVNKNTHPGKRISLPRCALNHFKGGTIRKLSFEKHSNQIFKSNRALSSLQERGLGRGVFSLPYIVVILGLVPST